MIEQNKLTAKELKQKQRKDRNALNLPDIKQHQKVRKDYNKFQK